MGGVILVGGRAMVTGAYEGQGSQAVGYTAGPLEFMVGKEGFKGDLHKAGVAAKLSPDSIVVEYEGRRYTLKEGTVKTLMALSRDLTNPETREDKDEAAVSLSATGPTAEATLDEVCYRLFTPVEEQKERDAQEQKMDA